MFHVFPMFPMFHLFHTSHRIGGPCSINIRYSSYFLVVETQFLLDLAKKNAEQIQHGKQMHVEQMEQMEQVEHVEHVEQVEHVERVERVGQVYKTYDCDV